MYDNGFNEGDSVSTSLDRERLAIWQAHPHWSEERREHAWSQRKAEIASYLLTDASVPRQLHAEVIGSSPPLASVTKQEPLAVDIPGARKRSLQASKRSSAVPMSRSKSSKSSHLSNMSAPPSRIQQHSTNSTAQRALQQTNTGYSASYTYGAPQHWQPTGETATQQTQNEFIFDPAQYIELSEQCGISQLTTSSKRQRVEGFTPSSLTSFQSNVSPSTSLSSDLSPSYPFTTSGSEGMSRQSSMSSIADGIGMMRMGSSLSACSDSNLFSFDETEEELAASFVSCVTAKPSSSTTTTTGYQYDDSSLLSGVGYGSVGSQQHFFYDSSLCADAMPADQGCDWKMGLPVGPGEEMTRSASDESNGDLSSAEIKSQERLQKHINNGKRTIASKISPVGPTSGKHDSKARPLRPQEPGTKRKEPIPKSVYIRPQRPKLHCHRCNEHPDGFRGEHELRRHNERKHAERRKVWICVDPHVGTTDGLRPKRPLGICKQCMHQKPYSVYYNAAAHLRRAHFNPRKRGRKARGEQRESRAGKAGGDFPPIDWLKSSGFLKEIEIGPDYAGPVDAGADDGDEEYDDFDCMPAETDLELNMSADTLGFATYPMTTDFPYGYFTPDLDCGMLWPTNELPQAPPMEYTMSAPPVMMTTNDHGSLYTSNDLGFGVSNQF